MTTGFGRSFAGLCAIVMLSLWLVAVPARASAPPAVPQAPSLFQSGDAHADALALAARDAMRANPNTAIQLAMQIEKTLRAKPPSDINQIAIAQAQWLQAEAYLRLNAPDRAGPAIEQALQAIAPIRRPFKLRADLLLARGELDQMRASVATALADYQNAYKIFERVGETRSQAIALLNIASLYRQAGDQTTAMKYDRQSTEVYSGDPGLSVSTYNNQGNALRQLNRPAEAEEAYRQALVIASRMDSPLLKTRILANIARGQLEANQIDRAVVSLAEAERIAHSSPEAASYQAQLIAVAAQVALQRGNYRHAAALIAQAFQGTELTKTNLADRDLHKTAYETYQHLGRPDLALAHLEAMKRIDDQTAKLAASTNTALMAARFDFANQDLKITKLQKKEALRRLELERSRAQFQRTILIGVVTATIVGVSMLVFGLLTIRRSRNEVRAANIDLAATNSALEKALAAKTEFLATTSHEIRTPLNGILGMTQVMLADRKLAEDMRDRISVVHGAGVTMRALVDDILDVAKMESGNMTLEEVPLDLRATLTEVSRMWQDQAIGKGIAFDLDLADCPGMIAGDAARLRQIVFNLLSNALKFTSQGSVTLRACAAPGDRLRIIVGDTGIGIPADKLELIFESFRQVDAGTTRKFGGTGLGLAICRNLARAMGGDIAVESTPRTGSTFTVDLPLTLVADAEPAPAECDQPTGGLLIVDRNPIARSMLKTLFEPRAGRVQGVGSTAEAVAALDPLAVDTILIDDTTLQAEPDLAAALATVIAAVAPAKARVAVLWAQPTDQDIQTLKDAGTDIVVAKPIAGAALVDLLYPVDKANNAECGADHLVSRAA